MESAITSMLVISSFMSICQFITLLDGEKPSKRFCNLENITYIGKTIKKRTNGEIITYQERVLCNVQQFYSQLLKNKDTLQNLELETLGIKSDQKIPEDISRPLTDEEVEQILKKMKSTKSPADSQYNHRISKKPFGYNLNILS